jgi:hypothetical protein
LQKYGEKSAHLIFKKTRQTQVCFFEKEMSLAEEIARLLMEEHKIRASWVAEDQYSEKFDENMLIGNVGAAEITTSIAQSVKLRGKDKDKVTLLLHQTIDEAHECGCKPSVVTVQRGCMIETQCQKYTCGHPATVKNGPLFLYMAYH